MRIGHGYDVHRFGDGEHVILGGIKIPFTQALVAHSDGDVVLHALCDALLGACALGDMGRHFPDSDPALADVDSRKLLREVILLVRGQERKVVNIDITVVAQAPKIAPHVQGICLNIAADCEITVDRVNVKATTTERLGFTGRQEGIAVHAVVLLDGS